MSSAGNDSTLILRGARVFDGHSPELIEGAELVIADGLIREINPAASRSAKNRVADVGGRFVMPGLIDAHFHAYGIDWAIGRIDQMPTGLRALHARHILESAAQRGFTTVRDAAGGDHVLVRATELGLIRGPRVFPSGLALSQTGGHGDMRTREHGPMCPCGYSGSLSIVVDGPDAVRAAAREQLRRGATQIKLFLSGGVLSPTDPIWMDSFTDEEVLAAVEEAARLRTYVMAHAHTAEAAIRCARLGVRSIEHGSILDDEAVRVIREHDTMVVPTLAPMWVIETDAAGLGVPSAWVEKGREVGRHMLASFEMLVRAGVRTGFGTDLLGQHGRFQSQEFAIRKPLAPAIDILRSATTVNARLLGKEGELGELTPGARADLIVVDGDPLRDVATLTDVQRIQLVLRDGKTLKNTLPD